MLRWKQPHLALERLSFGAKRAMPINKLRRICKAIVEEDDPATLTFLIAELTKHLQRDEAAIKEKIEDFARVSKHRP